MAFAVDDFIIAFVMMVVSSALNYYIGRRNKQKARDAQVGNFDVPTAEEGKTIPVVFGTILVKDANVLDYFDPKTKEIKG